MIHSEFYKWQKLYEKKTGIHLSLIETLCSKFIVDSDGLAIFKEHENSIFISAICGDGKTMLSKVEEYAKEKQKKYLEAVCIRDINSWLKCFGFTEKKEYKFRGKIGYICTDVYNRAVVAIEVCEGCYSVYQRIGDKV